MAGNLFMIKATAITLPPGDFFVRHFNNEGELTTFDATRSADFKFTLDESGNTVRFRSLEFPKKFLRHKDFRLLLEEPAQDEGLDDFTFIALPPNNRVGAIFTQAFSFGSTNTNPDGSLKFPNFFIRHRDFHVFLNEVTPDDEQAKQDSSSQLVPTT